MPFLDAAFFEMGRFYTWNAGILFHLLFALIGSTVDIKPSEIVRLKVPDSYIQGKTYTFEDGRKASAFLGIPYAQPPIGNLRFQKPLPVSRWVGVKQTTHFRSRCYCVTDSIVNPSEDCLFLNVFAPGSSFKKPKKLLPIAFYIHGGGFHLDGAEAMGDENICRYLNSKDVIVVTFNYRVGFFGFLAIDENTPGNAGLWDMAAALKWVRDNALSFGGDVNQITVFGQSAGSIATDLFTISPATRKLFDKAIMLAGNGFVCDSVNPIKTLRDNALAFATNHGLKMRKGLTEKEKNALLLKYFKESPPENITIGWYPVKGEQYLTFPSMDFNFFPKDVGELRREAPRKRTISGITEFEGLLFLMGKPKDINIYDYVKFYMVDAKAFQHMNNTVADVILKTFVNTSLPVDSLEFYKQCTTALSDYIFNYPTWKAVNVRANSGETAYLYQFTYFKEGTLGNSTNIPFKASTHTLELPYLFGINVLPYGFHPNAEDKKKIDEFTTYLTNFMKTGNPGDDWTPYSPNKNSYFSFGQDSSKDGMWDNFCADRMPKWDDLYNKYDVNC